MDISEHLRPYLCGPAARRLSELPREYVYSPEAPARLAEAFRVRTRMSSVLVFFDHRTRSVAGEDCLAALRSAGWTVQECLIPDSEDGSLQIGRAHV